MFDRHQAEITVMQFTGHSLPVHQSMSVPWEFFFTSSHFVSQFPPTRLPLITAIRMYHFLPLHHLGMAVLDGSKVKIQHNMDMYCWFDSFTYEELSRVINVRCTSLIVEISETKRNGYRRWLPKFLRRLSSGACRFNPDCRWVTIQEYLTLVPGYD